MRVAAVILLTLGLGILAALQIHAIDRERAQWQKLTQNQTKSITTGLNKAWRESLKKAVATGLLKKMYKIKWGQSSSGAYALDFFPSKKDTKTNRTARSRSEHTKNLSGEYTWGRVVTIRSWVQNWPGEAPPNLEGLSLFERSYSDEEIREAVDLMFQAFAGRLDMSRVGSGITTCCAEGVLVRRVGGGHVLETLVPSVRELRKSSLLETFANEHNISRIDIRIHPWSVHFDLEPPLLGAEGGRIVFLSIAIAFIASGLIFGVASLGRLKRQMLQRVSFLTQVGHEIKTPLTALRLNVENLLRRNDDEICRGMLTSIDKVDRIFSELYFLNRSPSPIPKQTLKLEGEELVQALGELQAEFSVGLKAIYRNSELSEVSLRAERASMMIILRNLIGNGISYGGNVQLKVSRSETQLVIIVKDQGNGVAFADRKRIFSEYYRSKSAKVIRPDGLGVGLAIAKKLAREMGAKLKLDNPGREGAVFSLAMEVIV